MKASSPPPLSRGCLPPRRRRDRTLTGLGPRGPPAPPTFCSSCGRAGGGGGRGLPGSAFVFPTPITFAEVLRARGDAAVLHPEVTGGTREGGIGSGAPGRGGAHPAAGARRRIGGPGAAPTHSPGGAQLREARGALSPGCGAAARCAGAAAGRPERGMSVGWLAPLPGVRRARRLDAGRVGRAMAVARRSPARPFRPLLHSSSPLWSQAWPRCRRRLRSRPAGPVSG